MNEVWKDIKDFEGLYQISNFGRVRSLDRWVNNSSNGGYNLKGRVLANKKGTNDYSLTCLSKEGKQYYFLVHRLVGLHFIEMPEHVKESQRQEINHIDEDITNNHVDNLEWVTPKENMNHGTRVERCIEKFKETGFVKKVVQMDLEGNFIAEYESQIEASRQTGVRQGNISSAILGKYKTAGGYKWKFKEESIGGKNI